jgi:chromodomain-helicase-DNA-binding protein 1
MSEDAIRNNRSTEPVLLSQLYDTEPDWNEMEFLIKWKGQSHLHCQWKSISELQNVRFSFFLLVASNMLFTCAAL